MLIATNVQYNIVNNKQTCMHTHIHSLYSEQTVCLSVYPVSSSNWTCSSRNYLVAIKAKIMFTSDVPLLNPFDAHCCHMATAIRHHVPDRVKVSFVILTYKHSDDKSAWMSKIPNDDLTRSGTGCLIAVPIWQHLAS